MQDKNIFRICYYILKVAFYRLLAYNICRIVEGKWNISIANKVGQLDKKVIDALGLSLNEGEPIFIGPTNIAHMQSKHPADYARYGQMIPTIIASPDYVGQNPKDGSIEYVKEIVIDGVFVKVAVRLSNTNRLFVRSLYVLNTNRVNNFITRGTLKSV